MNEDNIKKMHKVNCAILEKLGITYTVKKENENDDIYCSTMEIMFKNKQGVKEATFKSVPDFMGKIDEEIINDRKSKMEFLKRTVDYVKKLEEEETDE